MEQLEKKYNIRWRGITTAMEKLKQSEKTARAPKIKRYASLNRWKENKCIVNLPETVDKDKTWEWTREDVL